MLFQPLRKIMDEPDLYVWPYYKNKKLIPTVTKNLQKVRQLTSQLIDLMECYFAKRPAFQTVDKKASKQNIQAFNLRVEDQLYYHRKGIFGKLLVSSEWRDLLSFSHFKQQVAHSAQTQNMRVTADT